MDGHESTTWRKASYSSGSGACVEIAVLHDGTIGIRDSKNPTTNLTIALAAWDAFLTNARRGALSL